jgi:hypothetical protein
MNTLPTRRGFLRMLGLGTLGTAALSLVDACTPTV